MLFAYIDSQGKEVSIASVDALRLRIELGAIVDETEFYDAGSDRWAPAHEHEVYRSFRRELNDPTDFGPPAAAAPADGAAFAEIIEDAVDEDEVGEARQSEEDDEDLLIEGGFEPVLDQETGGFTAEDDEVGISDDDEGPEDSEAWHQSDPFEEESDAAAFESELVTDDFEPEPITDEFEPVDESDIDSVEESEDEADEPFDFGGFGTLEVEELEEPETEEPPELAWDRPKTQLPEADDETDWDMSGELSDAGGRDEVEESPGADVFEQDPTPGEAAARRRDTGSVDPSPKRSGTAASPRRGPASNQRPAAPGSSRGTRSTPARRKLTPKRSFDVGRALTLILVVAALGAAGWFGFEILGANDGAPSRVASAAVTLPDLPVPLQPQLRQLAQRASTRMVAGFGFLSSRVTLAAGPGDEWLTGVYLANASDHMNVVNYWRNFETLVSDMRASEADLFEAAYRDEVSAANLDPDDAELLIERGLAGFEAAAPDRAVIYDQLQGVIDAAVDLHVFLMENESSIDFEPATGGGSRDPVLEAVPLTESLREEMMARMVEITDALDALGFLNVVATEPLLEIVGEKLVATGIR